MGKLSVKGLDIAISDLSFHQDYISLTDIAKYKDEVNPRFIIQNWMRSRNTVEFLGVWETLYNEDFNRVEFEAFRKQAGLNSFVLTPQKWIETTDAKGIISKAGRYGGTYAHKEIAFEFASWISVEFKLYLVKEFERLKSAELKQLDWDIKRNYEEVINMGKREAHSKITYNNMAAGYDTSSEGSYTRPHKAELIRRVELCDGDSVLDVACGNGTLLGELSSKATIFAYGVDLSENMIAAAKERHPTCTFTVSACVPLPFAENSMNFITVSCAFHHFEEPGTFASECMRVLKPDGTLYMAEPFFHPVVRWLANLVWVPFAKSGDVRIYNGKELCRIFKTAGFCAIKTEAKGSVLFFSAQK